MNHRTRFDEKSWSKYVEAKISIVANKVRGVFVCGGSHCDPFLEGVNDLVEFLFSGFHVFALV